jgi:dTMP kinase
MARNSVSGYHYSEREPDLCFIDGQRTAGVYTTHMEFARRRRIGKRIEELLEERERQRGLFIAFEGPDGSGKTTQRKHFKTWLESEGVDVVTTKWNSSEVIKPLVKARKAARSLSPREFSLIHAADFRYRIDTEIIPALWNGTTVVADRHFFTALARDSARGMELDWLLHLYAPLFWPDIVFYFSVSVATSHKRIALERAPNFYEAGQDITEDDSSHDSYLKFMGRVIQEYEALAGVFKFVVVDAEQSIFQQHRLIRELYQKYERRPWSERNQEALVDWLTNHPERMKGQVAHAG